MPTREEMQSLAEEIVGSYEDRAVSIAELRETVKVDLKEFQNSRTAMGRELRADLAKGVADRKAAVSAELKELNRTRAAMSKELKTDLAKSVTPLKQDVGGMLKGFNDAHAAMSGELRADLAKVRLALEEEDKKRQSEAREFRGELGKVVAEGKAATRTLLRDFGEVQAGARDEWQKLTATIRAKRGGLVVEVKPVEPVAAAPVEEVAEEEAVAHAQVAEVTPEITAIRDRVFEYLANHPDGTRLAELEEEFGLARVQMARVVRNLIDENKVEKRDLLYFAI